MKLHNKTVVVTGGARGIGKALCEAFANEGAKVMVADLLEHEAIATAADIDGAGVRCDVTCEKDINDLIHYTEQRFGPIDLFCSNAGICVGEPDHAASASNQQLGYSVKLVMLLTLCQNTQRLVLQNLLPSRTETMA